MSTSVKPYKSLQERIAEANAKVASFHPQTFRDGIKERSEIIRELFRRGETDFHVADVLDLHPMQVRQIRKGLPLEDQNQIAYARRSNKRQERIYRARLAKWQRIRAHCEKTVINGVRRAEYQVWRGMLSRCYNPNCHSYKNYGAVGVTVCDRWNPNKSGRAAFTNFFQDMGPRPEGKKNGRALYSIHRVNSIRSTIRITADG